MLECFLTNWFALPLLVRKLPVGLYVAVRVWSPSVEKEVVQWAVPLDSVMGWAPSVHVKVVAPSLKLTVPVGPEPPVTVAVNTVVLPGDAVKVAGVPEVSVVVVEVAAAETERIRSQLVKDTASPGTSSTR